MSNQSWRINMRKNSSQLIKINLILTIILASTSVGVFGRETAPYATLDLLVNTDLHEKYGKILSDNLAAIGLKIVIEKVESSTDFNLKLNTGNFELALITFEEDSSDPDLSHIYKPDGAYNYFGMNYIYPYMNESSMMLENGLVITNQTERILHYHYWQELIVDKLIPILPLFSLTERGETLPYSYEVLAFNLDAPFWGGANHFTWLDSPGKQAYTISLSIRKAICYSINRAEINDKYNNNEYAINHSPISYYLETYYYEDIMKYEYDLEEAYDWLAAVGIDDITPYESDFAFSVILMIPLIILFMKRKKK